MDTLDHKILTALKQNARQKASDISRDVHLSVSSVIDRIRKLESSGIIKAYTIITDESHIGNDLTALMEVSLEHPRCREGFVQFVQQHPNIVSCYYLAGEYDYMLKICCPSSHALEEIHQNIQQQDGVCHTRTHFVLSTEKNIFSSLPEEPEAMAKAE